MGVLGSIPSGILFPVAFVVVRYVGLVLGINKPAPNGIEQSKGAPMSEVKRIVSGILETAWALGVSVLAGLPLLT